MTRRSPLTCRARRAFSLIELMLVVAIMAVFAAMAAPRYTDALYRYRADAAARRIAADLTMAQSKARSLATSRSVVFSISGKSYQIPNETDLNLSGGAYSVNLGSAPYYVAIGTVSFNGNASVTFNGYGVPNNAGSVQVTAGNVVRTISIDSASGVVTVQ